MVVAMEDEVLLQKEAVVPRLASLGHYAAILHDASAPLPARFRALFSLRNISTPEAAQVISEAFSKTDSALLKHELAYCLGQMRLPSVVAHLEEILADSKEDPMVRHEAGEALGAIGAEPSLTVLKRFADDMTEDVSVRETCQIAIDCIERNDRSVLCPCQHSKDIEFGSVDPAPPLNERLEVSELEAMLLDGSIPLYQRYRAMFSLRNRASTDAVLSLCKGLQDSSALFRHEVAYVLGQLQSPASIDALSERLLMAEEVGMVRHECAEALGSIADDRCLDILRRFAGDPVQVVRESCQVALDMWEFERGLELH